MIVIWHQSKRKDKSHHIFAILVQIYESTADMNLIFKINSWKNATYPKTFRFLLYTAKTTTATRIMARHTRMAIRKFILRLRAIGAATKPASHPGVKLSPSAGLPRSYKVFFPLAENVRFFMQPANPFPTGMSNL